MNKKIPFASAEFLLSAVSDEQFPTVKGIHGQPLPEIAIVGRSNVGKSSLINNLLNSRKVAKVSSTPGKTQALNFFKIDQQLVLVDLPGYGFAKVCNNMRKSWSLTIESYFQNREPLQLILFLLDSRRIPSEEDCAFLDWAYHSKKNFLLIFTKSDKLKDRELEANFVETFELFKTFLKRVPTQFLHYSIKDPHARIDLIEKINSLLKKTSSHS